MHESDSDTLQYALDNNVIMIRIPPHTSHYIHPRDRSFFRSLKVTTTVLVIVGSKRIQPEGSQNSNLECSSPRLGGRSDLLKME
jgi:hypothetical protein